MAPRLLPLLLQSTTTSQTSGEARHENKIDTSYSRVVSSFLFFLDNSKVSCPLLPHGRVVFTFGSFFFLFQLHQVRRVRHKSGLEQHQGAIYLSFSFFSAVFFHFVIVHANLSMNAKPCLVFISSSSSVFLTLPFLSLSMFIIIIILGLHAGPHRAVSVQHQPLPLGTQPCQTISAEPARAERVQLTGKDWWRHRPDRGEEKSCQYSAVVRKMIISATSECVHTSVHTSTTRAQAGNKKRKTFHFPERSLSLFLVSTLSSLSSLHLLIYVVSLLHFVFLVLAVDFATSFFFKKRPEKPTEWLWPNTRKSTFARAKTKTATQLRFLRGYGPRACSARN